MKKQNKSDIPQAEEIVIGSGSPSPYNRLEEAERLLRETPVQYVAFDRLAECTTADMHLKKSRGERGFDMELESHVSRLLPIAQQNGVRLITNAGGEDPEGALMLAVEIARQAGVRGLRIGGIIPQDDYMEVVNQVDPIVVETGQRVSELAGDVLGAAVYESSRPISRALEEDAHLVIAGRVGDSACYMATLAFAFGWDWTDWDRLARGMAVGHLLECSAHLTGGYYASPPKKAVPQLAAVGHPYAIVDPDGNAIFTKANSAGGKVTVPIVKEQMLYEVGDPTRYIHADVVVDWSEASISQVGPDRVSVQGVRGHERPETLKVLLGVRQGYVAECYVTFGGTGAFERAQLTASIMHERIDLMGLKVIDYRATFLGINELFAPWEREPIVPREVTVHIAGRFETEEEAKAFAYDCYNGAGNHYGPAGGTPGRVPPVDETLSILSTFIPRDSVKEAVVVIHDL